MTRNQGEVVSSTTYADSIRLGLKSAGKIAFNAARAKASKDNKQANKESKGGKVSSFPAKPGDWPFPANRKPGWPFGVSVLLSRKKLQDTKVFWGVRRCEVRLTSSSFACCSRTTVPAYMCTYMHIHRDLSAVQARLHARGGTHAGQCQVSLWTMDQAALAV